MAYLLKAGSRTVSIFPPFLKQENSAKQLKHNSCVVDFSFASFCEVEGGSMPVPLAALRVPELQGGH